MEPYNKNKLTIYIAELVKKNKCIATVFKKFNLYDSFTFVTFFFSEIEKLWLISVKIGSVKINGINVTSNKILNNQSVIEIGNIKFDFINLSNGIGLSEKIIEKIFIQNEENLKITEIINYVDDFQNKEFILEYLSKNELFYRIKDVCKINYQKYIELLEKQTDPLIKSMLFEMEITKCCLKSFNVNNLWNNIMFTGEGISNIEKDQKNINYEISRVSWPFNRNINSLICDNRGNNNFEKEKRKFEEKKYKYRTNEIINADNNMNERLNKLKKMIEYSDSGETKSNEEEIKKNKDDNDEKNKNNKFKKVNNWIENNKIEKMNKLLDNSVILNNKMKEEEKMNKKNKEYNFNYKKGYEIKTIENKIKNEEVDNKKNKYLNKKEIEKIQFIKECTDFMKEFNENYGNNLNNLNDSLESIDYIKRFNENFSTKLNKNKNLSEKNEYLDNINYSHGNSLINKNKMKREYDIITEIKKSNNNNIENIENKYKNNIKNEFINEIENTKNEFINDNRYLNNNKFFNYNTVDEENNTNEFLNFNIVDEENNTNEFFNYNTIDEENNINDNRYLNNKEFFNYNSVNEKNNYKLSEKNEFLIKKIFNEKLNEYNKFKKENNNKIEINHGFLTKNQEDCIKSYNDFKKSSIFKSCEKMKNLKLKSNSFSNILDHVKVKKNDYFTNIEDYGNLKKNFDLFFKYKTVDNELGLKIMMKEWLYKDCSKLDFFYNNTNSKSMECIFNKKDYLENENFSLEMFNNSTNFKNSLLLSTGSNKSYNENYFEENTCNCSKIIYKIHENNLLKFKPKKRKANISANKKLKISYNSETIPVIHKRPTYNLKDSPNVNEYNTLDFFKERLMNLKRSKSATELGQHYKIRFEDKQISESKCRKNKRRREKIFGFFDL